MAAVLGIDLGTSNSVMALTGIETKVLNNAEGDPLTPSAVCFHSDGVRVGKPARDLRMLYQRETITSVKRLMGRWIEEPAVQRLVSDHRLAYAIEGDEDEGKFGNVVVRVGDRVINPAEVSALVLKKLKLDAETALNAVVDKVVVTVPAYFGDTQKHATRRACELAGLSVLRLLPEPTAAALAFGSGAASEDQTLLVFDFGGGTLDISVLHCADGQFIEVAKGGDMWLGGDDIDHLIRNWVVEQAEAADKAFRLQDALAALSDDDRARFATTCAEACERAKVSLSERDAASIDLYGLLKNSRDELVDMDCELTRGEFARLLAPLCQRMIDLCRRTLASAGLTVEWIDRVLMVGGSSQIACVQEALRGLFGHDKVYVHPRPMLAIAEGAGLLAQSLASAGAEARQTRLQHTTAHRYSLQLAGGAAHVLVDRNAPLPARVTETLRFVNPTQVVARLRVVNDIDGISEPACEVWVFRDDADPLEFRLFSEESHDRVPEVDVEFLVDEDNIITLSSQIKGTHQAQRVVRGSLCLSVFSHLENELSATLGQAHATSSVVQSLCRLAVVPVQTILAIGATSDKSAQRALHLRALKQIDTLCAVVRLDVDLTYCLALDRELIKHLKPIMHSEALVKWESQSNAFERACRDLTDVGAISAFLDARPSECLTTNDLRPLRDAAMQGTALKLVDRLTMLATSFRRNNRDHKRCQRYLEEYPQLLAKGLWQQAESMAEDIAEYVGNFVSSGGDTNTSTFLRDVTLN